MQSSTSVNATFKYYDGTTQTFNNIIPTATDERIQAFAADIATLKDTGQKTVTKNVKTKFEYEEDE